MEFRFHAGGKPTSVFVLFSRGKRIGKAIFLLPKDMGDGGRKHMVGSNSCAVPRVCGLMHDCSRSIPPSLPFLAVFATSMASLQWAERSFRSEESFRDMERLHPMWILPVAAFMEMRGPPLPHQVLMALNVLVEHQQGSLTMFVSHQWLGHRHPDVAGEQMDVLRSALENLIQGTVTVEETVLMQLSGVRSKFPKPADLKKAFIWMDWFSIPQVVAANDEAAKLQAAHDAELAIRSIPL
eukprot:s6302_g1.t1